MQESSSLPDLQVQTLETKTAFKYTDFRISRKIPAPNCRSTGRSTDRAVDRPFHRSTWRSTGCPTESWVTSVGRPGGRPSSFHVHVVHIGRPGRSTNYLLVRAVDRAGRPLSLFCCCYFLLLLFPSPFVVDFLGDHLDDPSAIHVSFLSNILSFQHYAPGPS